MVDLFQVTPFPASCAPDTSLDIHMHPKTIDSTSHQNFNNSVWYKVALLVAWFLKVF